jgi:hypothetical protein
MNKRPTKQWMQKINGFLPMMEKGTRTRFVAGWSRDVHSPVGPAQPKWSIKMALNHHKREERKMEEGHRMYKRAEKRVIIIIATSGNERKEGSGHHFDGGHLNPSLSKKGEERRMVGIASHHIGIGKKKGLQFAPF